MRILSLGAGVQSSTVLLLGCRGEERIDAAIFADTGWEPAAVYAHLAWLETQAQAAGIPVYRVSAGNLRADALDPAHRFVSLPLYTLGADGREGMLRRQCTKEYKIAPIRKQAKALGATAKHPATLLMGISTDEALRMRDSNVRYIQHGYPLIDRRWNRADCVRWLAAHYQRAAPRSACIGCPYRRDREWGALPPSEWADAVAFDAAIRTVVPQQGRKSTLPVFLHRSLRPLSEVDLRTPQEQGQLALDGFGEECTGMCGV